MALVLVVAVSLSSSAANAAPAGFVTRDGTRLELNGEPYRFTGINIYNANNASGCWYAMSSGSTLADSLDAISPGGGPMAMRAWFFQALATRDGQRDWSGFDHTLAVAASRGVKVIVTLGNQWADCDGPNGGAGAYKSRSWYETGYTQPDVAGTMSYRDYVAEIVARYADNPTILAWQLMNEAEASDSQGGSCSPDAHAALKSFAEDVSGLVESIDPDHLVSLGTISTGQCGAGSAAEYSDLHGIPTIDLCEYHDYGSPTVPMPGDEWNGLQNRLDQCSALGKPLFVGETGIDPGSLTNGTTQLRASLFEQKFRAQFAAGVVGELVWAWNKDGSVGSYDIGPGDPALAILSWWTSPSAGSITRASLTAGGAEPNDRSLRPYVTPNGRHVLFSSEATNLSPADTFSNPGCGALDVFLKDVATGAVELVNVDSNELQLRGFCGSIGMGISDDARFVVFESDAYRSATQYVGSDVLVRDRQAGTTTNLTASANNRSGNTQITPDGRYVLFGSEATNLVPGTASCGARWRQYVFDRKTSALELVSVDSSGNDPCGGNGSNLGAISADGRFVAFQSDAVLGPDGYASGIYLRDRLLGQTTLVSHDQSGSPVNGFAPALSADGRFVSFTTFSPGDATTYVVDRTTGTSERVSVDTDGHPLRASGYSAITAGGRFVVFGAMATQVDPRSADLDLWIRDRVEGSSTRVVNAEEIPGGGFFDPATITGDGRYVAFAAGGAGWVPGDANAVPDIFVHERTGPLDPFAPPSPDADGDGVANAIDVGNGAFDDGQGSVGQITAVPAGVSVLVEDISPDGVRITVTGTGTSKATFSVCGYPGTLKLAPGSVLELTCGSVRLRVTQGSAEFDLPQLSTVVTVPAGVTAKLDQAVGTPTVQNLGGGTVTLTTGGTTTTVPAATTSPALPPNGLCALTRQTVQGSTKWQTAKPVQRAAATALVAAGCKALEQIKPTTKAAPKKGLVIAYKATVDALRVAGWLTTTQSTSLKRHADTL